MTTIELIEAMEKMCVAVDTFDRREEWTSQELHELQIRSLRLIMLALMELLKGA